MIDISIAQSDLWQLLGWIMIHFLWVGAIIALVAACLRWGLGRTSSQARYVAGLLTLAALSLAPVGIGVGLHARPSAPSVGDLPTGAAPGEPQSQPSPSIPGLAKSASASPSPTTSLRDAPEVVPSSTPDNLLRMDVIVALLPWLWVVGTPVTFLILAMGLLGAERLRRQGHPSPPAILAACARLGKSLRISQSVAVQIHEQVACPLVVGVFRPLIVLPAAFVAGCMPAQLEMILLHELAHVRRWDNLVNLCQRVVEAFLFFHPAVWWVSNWIRLERECCCDEIVLAQTGQRRAYAQILAALALAPRPVVAGAVAMAEHAVVTRVRRLLGLEDQSLKLSRLAVGAVTLLLSLGVAGFFVMVGQDRAARAEPANQKDAVNARIRKLLAEAVQQVGTEPLQSPSSELANRLLGEIAVYQKKAGDDTGAKDTIEKARAVIDSTDRSNRPLEYRLLAPQYAYLGQKQAALDMMKLVPDPLSNPPISRDEFQDMVFQETARYLAKEGREKGALEFADLIRSPSTKAWVSANVLVEVALFQARKGQLDEATKTVERMADAENKVAALTGIVRQNLAPFKYPAESGIAIIMAERSDRAAAREALEKAISLAPTAKKQPEVWASIACAQARLGDVDAGLQSANKCKGSPYGDIAMAAVVTALGMQGKSKEAMKIIDSLSNVGSRVHALYHFAGGQAAAGNLDEAKQSFQIAVELLKNADETTKRYQCHNLISVQALAGDIAGALRSLDLFKATANSIITRGNIDYGRAQTGDFKGARRAVEDYRDGWGKGNLVRGIAAEQTKKGDDQGAVAWADGMTPGFLRASALVGVAEALAGYQALR